MLLLLQVRPRSHGRPLVQQASPSAPQAVAVSLLVPPPSAACATQVPRRQVSPSSQVLPAQQASPSPPQTVAVSLLVPPPSTAAEPRRVRTGR